MGEGHATDFSTITLVPTPTSTNGMLTDSISMSSTICRRSHASTTEPMAPTPN